MLTEFDHLFACLRYDTTIATPAPELTESEWATVVQQATNSGITPLLYHKLSLLQWLPFLPSDLRTLLARHYQTNAVRNLQLFTQSLRVLHALQGKGVPAILLKGLHLANFVYQAQAIRTMGDIDILVPLQLMPQAEQTLQTLQYELLSTQKAWHETEHYHLGYRLPDQPSSLELHWHVQRKAATSAVDLDAVWRRATPTTVAGVDFYLFSTPDLLVFLCLHLVKHAFVYRGLRSLYDIAELVHAHLADKEWPLVLQYAAEWQVKKQVHLSLLLAQQIFGVTVPSFVMTTLAAPDFNPSLIDWALEQICRPHDDKLSGAYVKLWQLPSVQTKFAQLARVFFLPRTELAALYAVPTDSYSLYFFYMVRWLGLLRRYGKTTLALHRGQREDVARLARSQQIELLNEWFILP